MTDGKDQWTPEMVGEVIADALGVGDAAPVLEAEELRERLEASIAGRTGRGRVGLFEEMTAEGVHVVDLGGGL